MRLPCKPVQRLIVVLMVGAGVVFAPRQSFAQG